MATFQPCETLFSYLKERLARLPNEVAQTSSSGHVTAIAVEHLIKTTPKRVVRECVRSSEHYRTAWLARAQACTTAGELLSFSDVEKLVRECDNRPSDNNTSGDIGDYDTEMSILFSMLDTYGGVISVKFQEVEGQELRTVRAAGVDDLEPNGGSIILVNPEGLPESKITAKKHFLEQEQLAQSPESHWESLPEPRSTTLSALQTEKLALKRLYELEKRSREYFIQNKVIKQVKRVRRAASSSSSSNS